MMEPNADLAEVRSHIERQCSKEDLEFQIVQGFDQCAESAWMAIEAAVILPCCEEGEGGVMWTAWRIDATGTPSVSGSHGHLCGGCGSNGTDNSFLSRTVFIKATDAGDWQDRVDSIIGDCVEFRDETRRRAERSLLSEIDELLASGDWRQLGTDAEAATRNDGRHDRAIWLDGDAVLGFCGWGENSRIADVWVEVRAEKK